MNLHHLATHSTTVMTYKMAIVLRPYIYVTSFHPIYMPSFNFKTSDLAELYMSKY